MCARSLLVAAFWAALVVSGCAGDDPEEAGPPTATSPAGTTTEPAETETETEPAETDTGPAEPAGPLRLVRVAEGLESPLYVTFAPGEPERLYVLEQVGRIAVVEDGRVRTERFLDVSDEVVAGGEQGLLGLAFHPRYEANRLLYVHYTNVEGDTRVVEYRARADRRGVDESSARALFAEEQPYSNHNGGQLAFAPDGRLWLGLGDGGSGGDPENRAQNLSSRLGKLLAIDVDRPEPRAEIVAYGLRNPWRFSFDRETGDLWIGDVGQSAFEEVNRLPRGRLGELVNFGWDVFEGRAPYEDKEPNPAGELVEPVVVYDRGQGISVTGGYVYRGTDVPSAVGRYFYGDYGSGTIWSLPADGGSPRVEPFEVDALSSFGEGAQGELYLVSLEGTVFRLAA
jgi:glucose/arabinose dehydrogenase